MIEILVLAVLIIVYAYGLQFGWMDIIIRNPILVFLAIILLLIIGSSLQNGVPGPVIP